MKNRVDEVRRRIEKRKRDMKQHGFERNHSHGLGQRVKPNATAKRTIALPEDEERHGLAPFGSGGQGGGSSHPLFNKEAFMFRVLASIALFLIVGLIFKSGSTSLEGTKSFVTSTFEDEFEFAAVSNWYEEVFGTPVALFPEVDRDGNQPSQQDQPLHYAEPVNGRVTETFQVNGQGILLETGPASTVEAVEEGIVIYAGQKEDLGNTVIIQHADGLKTWESWYGHLQSIDVRLYDFVEGKTEVGKVESSADGLAGTFYFAIKRDGEFIDPLQVLQFE